MSQELTQMEKNAAFVNAVTSAQDGHLKEASDGATPYIRSHIKERSYARVIMPPEPVPENRIQRDDSTDEMPYMLGEMERRAPGARVISFYGGADQVRYGGAKFRIRFHKVTTPEFWKQIDELKHYAHDVRQMITENALNQVETLEDKRLIDAVDEICGSVGGNGLAGMPQYTQSNGGITKRTWPFLKAYLPERELNNGLFLMNSVRTALAFETWDARDIGDETVTKMFRDGVQAAITTGKIGGVSTVFTIKRAQVADNVVYAFTERGFMGVAYEYEALRMYVRKEEDFIFFKAVEKIGFAIPNLAAVHKHRFNP